MTLPLPEDSRRGTHHVAPRLAERHTVGLTDLRGYETTEALLDFLA